jgi:acyl dehydratase
VAQHDESLEPGGSTGEEPEPDSAKHKEIPVWNAETWLFEDFEVGARSRSIRRNISEGESMAFNALVLDMHPYVADDFFAKEEGAFGRRLIAGTMVFSLGLGLMAHNNVHTFSYGYDKVRFIKPVLSETRSTPFVRISKSRPSIPASEWYESRTKSSKSREKLVLYCEHLQTVKYREATQFQTQTAKE